MTKNCVFLHQTLLKNCILRQHPTHDVLVVVDGKGKMRIYLDGKAGKTTQGADDGTHKPKEVPSKGLKPFTFSFNYADYAAGDNTFDAQLARANERAFTTDYGYIARFKFYSNKNYAEMQNGAGTDISDANVLSDEFDNFSIATLETDRTKDEVYSIITNMLQKEQPTARITLCPYNRSTVWSKYDTDSNTWVDMAATEKFANTATTKYRAKTTLDADDGFVFNEACKENVITNLTAEDASATTVKISEKDRRLEIVNYYNCEENDAAFPDEVCAIDELTLLDDDDDPDYDLDEIHMVYDADAQSQATKTIKKPEVKFSTCAKHTDAKAKISYAVTKGSEYADVNADTGVITPKKVSKLKIGYAPVTITVTASLVRTNDSGEEEAVTGANNQPVKASDTISIEIDTPPAQEDTVISTAPTITTKMPKTGDFPEVADVKMIYADAETASNSGEYHNDIADRMEPAATFDWLTEDYVNTLPDGSGAAGGYDTNKNQRPPQMPTVEEPSIVNIDGVWAFNGQAQTRGTENKFDVFGEDVKVISFKWYLKRWPTSGNKSIFGKGDKYAVQFTTDKLFMYMENRNGGWPQENFTVAAADKEAFLNKWHNVFMVVDGKGWQRLYVDGVASTTDTAGRPAQGQAFAAENPSQGRKPFSLGYNSSDTNQGTPNWWTQMFTKDDGYIADLQFYTNKHYYDMINGAGTDISSAHVMSDELAEYINIADLEGNADYNGHLDAIITNLLQSENATVNISATPYTAKTIWKQKNASGQFEVVQRAQKFTALSEFQSIVTLTAHDGFKFADSVTTAAETNFNKSETGENRPTVSAELSADKKVLTVTAVYGATEDVDCTCAIKSFTLPQDQAAIALELEDGADATAEVTLADLNTAEDYSGIISTENCQNSHFNDPENRRYQFTYTLDTENSSENITFDPQTRKVTATKSGTAKIKVKATLQIKNAEGTFENVTNAAGDPAEKEAVITVTASRKNKPSSAEVTALNNAITTAERDFPAEVAEDYDSTKWQNLQTALTAAKGIDTTDAVSSAVTSATTNLTNAMDALKEADAKSEKGKAKDAVRSALTDAEVLYNAGNADQKYTEESWNKFKAAYEAADLTAEQMKEKTVAELNTLAEALKAAATEGPNGLVIKTTDPGKKDPVVSTVKDGDVLPGADGSQYQVASAKDKTVIITKGVDVKSVKVGPTVALKGETYKVIGIGNSAFKGLKKATKVVIDANVTSIGDQAFANSKKLKNVTIGKDVTKIGKKAFFKCPKLNKVILKGNALTDKGIGGSAFKKTAKKASVKWGPVKGKARTKLKKKLKKAGLKVK